MTQEKSPYKSKGGPGRLINALRYSAQGLGAAFKHEAAFRQELLAAIVLIPIAFWIGQSTGETILLIGTLFVVLIVEVINSAIEAVADTITMGYHPMIGRAKDLGSAAVMLSIIFSVIVWATVITKHVLAA